MNAQRQQYHPLRLRAQAPRVTSDQTVVRPPNQPARKPAPLTGPKPRPVAQPMPTLPDEDQVYQEPNILPKSAIRYTSKSGDQMYQQGNKRLIVTYGRPPQSPQKHWMLYTGVGMLAMAAVIGAGNIASNWWTNHQLQSEYGTPPTWQTDSVVGHHDDPMHPSHFMFMDLNSHVVVVEIPGGDVTHATLYSGPPILGNVTYPVPVTGEFRDTKHNGKPEMLIHIGSQTIIYVNNGTQFMPAS